MSLSAVGLKGEIDFSENEAPVTEGAGLFSPVTIKLFNLSAHKPLVLFKSLTRIFPE